MLAAVVTRRAVTTRTSRSGDTGCHDHGRPEPGEPRRTPAAVDPTTSRSPPASRPRLRSLVARPRPRCPSTSREVGQLERAISRPPTATLCSSSASPPGPSTSMPDERRADRGRRRRDHRHGRVDGPGRRSRATPSTTTRPPTRLRRRGRGAGLRPRVADRPRDVQGRSTTPTSSRRPGDCRLGIRRSCTDAAHDRRRLTRLDRRRPTS